MSRELFKSMVYQDGKVYTRQSSNNVSPKYYDRQYHKGLSDLYNKLGEVGFEKWFITNCIMQGNVEILSGSNKVLKRLDYISNLLWNDEHYQKMRDIKESLYCSFLLAKDESEKEIRNRKSLNHDNEIAKYISSFYDKHNSEYKEKNSYER